MDVVRYRRSQRPRVPGFSLLGTVMLALAMSSSAGAQVIRFVDSSAPSGGDGLSWNTAYTDLQSALDEARTGVPAAGFEARVAQGIYKPDRGTSSRDASFDLPSGVTVRGGYAGRGAANPDARDLFAYSTVLSGDLAGDDAGTAGPRIDNSHHVVRVTGAFRTTVLEGCVVSGGAADATGLDGLGGGMLIDGGLDRVVVSHCRFLANISRHAGGGLYSANAGPRIQQSLFAWNTSAFGSGAYIEVTQRSLPAGLVVNCTFANNVSKPDLGQGGFGDALNAYIVEWDSPRVLVRQCVAGGNTSLRGFGFPAQYEGFLTFQRCQSVEASMSSSFAGNLIGVPGFVDPDGADNIPGTPDDDFRLVMGSICDDWGDAALAPQDLSDIDGDGDRTEPCPLDAALGLRFLDDVAAPDNGVGSAPQIDLGAFEGPVARAIVVSPVQDIPEGQSTDWTVALSRPPRNGSLTLVITVAGDPSITVDPPTIDFDASNWSTLRTITVSAAQDANFVSFPADVLFRGAELAEVHVRATGIDDDSPSGVIRVVPGGPANGSGSTWADAAPSLERALQLATQFPATQEIWLASGTYRAPTNAGFTARSGLSIMGGFSGTETSADQRSRPLVPSVVTGDVLGDDGPALANRADNARVVLNFPSGPGAVLLDGLTITGGAGLSTNNGNGGGVVIDFTGGATLRDCSFIDNYGRGANVAYNSGAVTVMGCRFAGNKSTCTSSATAPTNGLKIEAFADGLSASIDNCVFESNRGPEGAGLWIYADHLTVTNSQFRQNFAEAIVGTGSCSATIRGAGVFMQLGTDPAGDTFQVSGCTFEGNHADGYGAGVYMQGRGTGSFNDCVFNQNEIVGVASGGGIFQNLINPGGDAGTMYLNRCRFTGNIGQSGAAASVGASVVHAVNCVVSGNTGQTQVMAVPDADNCIFEDNVTSVSGGALAAARVTNCVFRRNRSPSAGALMSDLTSGEVIGCTFDGNQATAGDGGAISQAFRVRNCVFINNTATARGGATFQCRSIANCRFIANHAGTDGGAVWEAGDGGVTNSGFSLNTAARGGAVYVDNSSRYVVSSCAFAENSATTVCGGVFVRRDNSDNRPSIVNCILYNNSDPTGMTEAAQVTGLPLTYPPNPQGAPSGFGQPALFGPADGGFSPLPSIASLETAAGTPNRTVQITAAPGWVTSIGTSPRWVSTSSTGATTGGSFFAGTNILAIPFPINDLTLSATFACDDTLGETGVPGIYFNTQPIPGTEGVGRPDLATTIGPISVSHIMRPRTVPQSFFVYLRDISGGSGVIYALNLSIITRPISYSLITGLSTRTGFGNITGNPIFVDLAGPDGIRGTLDDSFQISTTSPAVDAGDSNSIDYDFADADSNTVTAERISVDMLGAPRTIDFPGVESGRGAPIVDMGPIELFPSSSLTVRCRADVTGDGQVTIQDLFDFLAHWFAQEPAGDFNRNGLYSIQDLFDFLGAFFGGCN